MAAIREPFLALPGLGLQFIPHRGERICRNLLFYLHDLTVGAYQDIFAVAIDHQLSFVERLSLLSFL